MGGREGVPRKTKAKDRTTARKVGKKRRWEGGCDSHTCAKPCICQASELLYPQECLSSSMTSNTLSYATSCTRVNESRHRDKQMHANNPHGVIIPFQHYANNSLPGLLPFVPLPVGRRTTNTNINTAITITRFRGFFNSSFTQTKLMMMPSRWVNT